MRLSDAKTAVRAAIDFNLALAQTGGRHAQTLVPYLEGPPGMGKTSIIEQIAEDIGARCEVIRLCDYEPSDLSGWVVADPNKKDGEIKMVQCRPNWMPDEGEEHPTIVFFDEMPQGSTSCQNAAAQIINERRIGQFSLPDNAVVVGAGNGAKDRAGTSHMPTHLRDRLTWLEVEPNPDDTCNYFAEVGVDFRVIAYLRFTPQRLSEFNRDAKACPSPRSWERVSSWLSTGLNGPLLQSTIGGQVGEAAAADFMAYLKLTQAVPDMDKLLANPEKADIPTDAGVLFAVASAVGQRIKTGDEKALKDADAAVRYLRRINRKEIQSFAIADAYRRDNTIIDHVERVREWFLTEGQKIFVNTQ